MIRNLSTTISNGENKIAVAGGLLGYHIVQINAPVGATISVDYSRIAGDIQLPAYLLVDGTVGGNWEFGIDRDVANLYVNATGLAEPVEMQIWLQTTDQPAGAFNGTRAIVTQPYDAINIKRGLQFVLPYYIATIAENSSHYIALETGDKPVIVKNRELDVNGGLEYKPYYGSTYVRGDEITDVVNLNGMSATVNTAKFYAVTGTPTVLGSSFDIVKSPNDVGGGRTLGRFPEGVERLIAPNTKVLLEFKSTQAQDIWVVFKPTWYEGNPDVPPDEPKP